jgi:hypothetical protein
LNIALILVIGLVLCFSGLILPTVIAEIESLPPSILTNLLIGSVAIFIVIVVYSFIKESGIA